MSRDVRLDLLRGYAMLAIALNHVTLVLEPLGFTQQNVPTLTAFGYSSAASIFFALSGYMIGLIILTRPAPVRALWKRVKLIYLVNAAAFASGFLIVSVQPTGVQQSLGYAVIFEYPALGLALFLTMLRHPALLDVLHMYVILILATPLMALLLTKRPAIALLISAGIYLGALFFPSFSVPAATLDPSGEWRLERWNMELLSWQFIFFAAMAAGPSRSHVKLFAWIEKSAKVRLLILGLFAAFAAIKLGEHAGLWGAPPLVDKRNLEPLRLLHAGLTILMLCTLLVVLNRYLHQRLARLIALVGRQTLYGFAASIPATYLAASAWAASDGSYAVYLVASLFVLTVVIAVSFLMEARSGGRGSRPDRPKQGLATS